MNDFIIFKDNSLFFFKYLFSIIVQTLKQPINKEKEITAFGSLNLSAVLLFIWAIGFSFCLILVLLEYYFLIKITKEKRNLVPPGWHTIFEEARQQIGASLTVEIMLSKRLNTPVTFCILRKNYILMPMNSLDWKERQIKTVFLHELGHLRQKDLLTNLLVQFVKAMYWWQPLIWIAVTKIRLECERSCDELVLESGVSSFDYAQNLTEIARIIFLAPAQLSKVALPVVNNSQLKERISKILKETNPSLNVASWRTSKMLLCLIIPLFCLNFNYTSNSIIQKKETTLIRQLSNANDVLKIEAAKTLGELRAIAAYAPLVATLNSENPLVRATAAWALGQIQKEEAISDLLPLINDQADCVKEWALLSLGEFGSSKSFYAVLQTQRHTNPEIRKATLWSLHQIGCLPSFHHISQHLQDENEEVSLLAKKLLADFPKEKLRRWLSKNQDVRHQQWIYGHFVGVKNLGTMDLFVERLAINWEEQEMLDKIIQAHNTVKVLEKIFSIID